MPEWLIPLISIVLGVASSWITFRIRFEQFMAMYNEREENRNEWRQEIHKRVSELEGRPVNGFGTIIHRLDKAEEEIGTHSTGLRGRVHALEGKVGSIQKWLLNRWNMKF